MTTPADANPTFQELLTAHQDDVRRLVEAGAGVLRRYESVHDLIQGANLRAIEGGEHFEYRGPEEFVGWLAVVVRQHLSRRRVYWSAAKRGSARVLRVTLHDSGISDVEIPAATGPGAVTFAGRREQLTLVTKALALLAERDRQLVRWDSEGVELQEQADRLGLSYAAVQRAAVRARERLRKTLRVLQGERGSRP